MHMLGMPALTVDPPRTEISVYGCALPGGGYVAREHVVPGLQHEAVRLVDPHG